MTDKFIFFLEELKENFSPKLLKDFFEYFRSEFVVADIDKNYERAKNAFNNQSELFYNELAYEFVENLNNVPFNYFHLWSQIFSFFEEEILNWFYKLALELSYNSNATFYIKGFLELENNNPEVALSHFNQIEDFLTTYFMAICYRDTGNFENSIKQNLFFLKNLNLVISEIKEINFNDLGSVRHLKWSVYNDLGYAYNRIYEFENALDCYKKTFDFLSLEDYYEIGHKYKVDDKFDYFTLYAENFLLSIERTNEIEECFELLNFLIEKYPQDKYYQNKKDKLIEQQNNSIDSNFVFNQVFKPKKPFGISSFEEIKLLSKEKALEDLIIEQIKYGYKVFGKSLEIYQDELIYGRQYRIFEINGILDLLLIDKENDQLYVVELKRNESGIEVVTQIENYVNSLSKQMNKNVKGIICLHKANPKLIELVKTKNNIELFTYSFDFLKLD